MIVGRRTRVFGTEVMDKHVGGHEDGAADLEGKIGQICGDSRHNRRKIVEALIQIFIEGREELTAAD